MSVYKKQIGGNHYIKYKIQPSKFVVENKLLYPEGNVIKYILRHHAKGGKEDLEKAKHFIDMIIERDYSVWGSNRMDSSRQFSRFKWI